MCARAAVVLHSHALLVPGGVFAVCASGVVPAAAQRTQKRKDDVRQEVTRSLLILVSHSVATESRSCRGNQFRCDAVVVLVKKKAAWLSVESNVWTRFCPWASGRWRRFRRVVLTV